MPYIGTLVKHCDHIKSIEQETQEEKRPSVRNHERTITPLLIPAPACGYLYIIIYTKNSYRVSI
jgi:hypothetical protein